MKRANVLMLWIPLLLALLVSATGCATNSGATLPPAPAPQVQLPPLPPEVELDPLPAWCLEGGSTTCSMRVQQLLKSWRQRLSEPAKSS